VAVPIGDGLGLGERRPDGSRTAVSLGVGWLHAPNARLAARISARAGHPRGRRWGYGVDAAGPITIAAQATSASALALQGPREAGVAMG